MSEEEDSFSVPVIWTGVEDVPVLACNHMSVSRDGEDGDFYLTLGNLTPPILIGDDAERRAAAARIGYIPVQTVGRVAVSARGLREFAGVLNTMIDKMDTAGGAR